MHLKIFLIYFSNLFPFHLLTELCNLYILSHLKCKKGGECAWVFFPVVSLISEHGFIFTQFPYFLSSLVVQMYLCFHTYVLTLCVCLTLLRFVEPDPSHTLEERVVHWYFAQLDKNGSNDINKKELKPFKRYLKKKGKPKKCARKFTDYCDLNKDRAISLQELKGCLGVSKEGKRRYSCTVNKEALLNMRKLLY